MTGSAQRFPVRLPQSAPQTKAPGVTAERFLEPSVWLPDVDCLFPAVRQQANSLAQV